MAARRAGPRLALLASLVARELADLLALRAVGVLAVIGVAVAPEPFQAGGVVGELAHELHQRIPRFRRLGALRVVCDRRAAYRKCRSNHLYSQGIVTTVVVTAPALVAAGLTALFPHHRLVHFAAIRCTFRTDHVGFSCDDLALHGRGYPALLDILGDKPVGALVFARNAISGDIWLPGGRRVQLDSTVIAGWPSRALRESPLPAPAGDATYDRQSRLFGDRGQAILTGQKVAVIGAGGAGSLIIGYPARFGVGHLFVIDPDRIDRSNLPRVVSSRFRDARMWLTDPARPAFLRSLGQRTATPGYALLVNPSKPCDACFTLVRNAGILHFLELVN